MAPVGLGALIAGLTILTYKTQTKMKTVSNKRKLMKNWLKSPKVMMKKQDIEI